MRSNATRSSTAGSSTAQAYNDDETMSNVTLTIGGRRYKLACAAGEEDHIAMLGHSIDAQLSALPALSRQSEAQTLLYAALLLADALHERERRACANRRANRCELADPLEKLAQKLESDRRRA